MPSLRTLTVSSGFGICLFSMLGKEMAGVPRRGTRRDNSPKMEGGLQEAELR